MPEPPGEMMYVPFIRPHPDYPQVSIEGYVLLPDAESWVEAEDLAYKYFAGYNGIVRSRGHDPKNMALRAQHFPKGALGRITVERGLEWFNEATKEGAEPPS